MHIGLIKTKELFPLNSASVPSERKGVTVEFRHRFTYFFKFGSVKFLNLFNVNPSHTQHVNRSLNTHREDRNLSETIYTIFNSNLLCKVFVFID
jgi:hypothetical protein